MKLDNRIGLILVNTTVIVLAFVAFGVLSSVQTISPYTGMIIDDRTPLFEWTGEDANYELIIDDDPSFSTPMTFDVKGNSFRIPDELEFGTYWWKLRTGDVESEAEAFTVVSKVEVSREEPSKVVNTGNAEILVHVNADGSVVVLGVNETLEVGEEDHVKAEQN